MRRIFITAAAAILLGLLYCVIFGFSAQDGEESGSLSRLVSEKCVNAVNSLAGGRWNSEDLDGMAEAMEKPLRKLAHFSEYACMGVLVWILLAQWMRRGRGLCLLTTGWVFLSAAGDEFHQYFVPGRYASPLDVLLDTCGGVCGMLFCLFAAALWQRRRRRISACCAEPSKKHSRNRRRELKRRKAGR